MESVRNNIFNLLNKGYRVLIYEAGIAVQQASFNDCEDLALAFEKIKDAANFSLVRGGHIEKEIFAFLPPHELQTLEKIKTNDRTVKCSAAKLISMIEGCEKNPPRSLLVFGHELTSLYYDYSSSALFFLNTEESALMKMLAQFYDDATICAIGRALLCNIEQKIKPMIFKYIIRGISDAETIRLLNNAKHVAPANELEQLMELAETELPATRWRAIEEGLLDGLCLDGNK